LNANRVITGMLQYDGNRIIRITCPAVGACRVNIQPIAHSGTLGFGSDLIIDLHPN